MSREYDVVVVGSGYGGAIAASRLARAGLKVCILERGDELQPGDFAESPTEGLGAVQMDLPDRHVGASTGLFDFHVNPDITVLSGCGLGGTSLINANVAIRPDERVWQDKIWPARILADLDGRVEQGVRRALEMLRPTPLPDHFPLPPKTAAMQKSAKAMGSKFYRLPITVNFEQQMNHVGVEQPPCNYCGNCVSGCNNGSKNTLLTNYLPDAHNHGAEIFTRTRVRTVEKQGDHWLVRFDVQDPGRMGFKAQALYVGARNVIISAGSLGSTEILLRSREAGLSLSDRLGHGFTGNGDVLGFAYNATDVINGIGISSDRDGMTGPGPCITSVIDLREGVRLEDGMIIEEGSIPSSLAPFLAASMFAAARLVGEHNAQGLKTSAAEAMRELKAFVPGGSTGAVGNTQTFLVMANDDAQGHIQLVDDRARISWPGVGKQPIFERINEQLKRAAEALGGTYIKNPTWSDRLGNSLVTVHPLGGCGMGDSAETGVVDHAGRVFSGRSGDQVHEGLYVSDGAVLPRALGCNPFLTISAVAERNAALLAERLGREVPYTLPSRPKATPAQKKIGVQFTEAMRGFFAMGDGDFETSAKAGQAAGSRLEFTATIDSDDLKGMLASENHRATLYGTVTAPALSAEPMTVTNGTFELFARDAEEVRTRRMNYQMPITAPDGTRYHMHGFKSVRDDKMGLDLWADTTTLFVTVYKGDGQQGPVVGRGILKIQPTDFARQMRTFKITNAGGIVPRLKAASDFGLFFAGSLYQTYGGVFASRSALKPDAAPRARRELRTEPPEVHFLRANDDVSLRLIRYPGGKNGPVLLVHGIGMSGLVYSIDTIDTNLVEYLSEAGYDVWVLDHRASIDLEASDGQFSVDDLAARDVPAAVAKVREATGASGVDVVAHGIGSMAVMMAVVDGLQGVRSLVSSAGGLHMSVPRASKLMAAVHLPAVMKKLGMDSLQAKTGAEKKSWKSKLADAALRVMPVELEEWCTSPVCRRITFMYGPLFEHDQINLATHESLHEMFGVVNLTVFDHITKMVREGHAVSTEGATYLRDLERLRIPITFLHGAENACMLPAGTESTLETLSGANGGDLYRYESIGDYGDIDCLIGKNAAKDVYPLILRHLRASAG